MPARAQTPAGATTAATITAADIARHIGVLADDSMRGRVTPSPELELAAQYIATRFARLGLRPYRPVGGSDPWIQRYPIPGQTPVDSSMSKIVFAHRGASDTIDRTATATFTATARFATEVGLRAVAPSKPRDVLATGASVSPADSAVLVAGEHTAASLPEAAMRDKVVLYIPPAGLDTAVQRQVLARLYAVSEGVVLLSEPDSAHFAAERREAHSTLPFLYEYLLDAVWARRSSWWAIAVWPPAIRDFLDAVGVDLAQVRADATPVVRPLPFVRVAFQAQPDYETAARAARQMAPNVMGVLDGSDSSLKHQFIIFTAHMDAGGVRPGGPDSLDAGADDNASGIAGLLALAQAFSQPGARPRRSLVFLATSGGAADKGSWEGSWGSNAFVYSGNDLTGNPPHAVLNVTLDMIGRRAGDSVTVDGAGDVELAVPPAWVAATHPELGVVFHDGGTATAPTGEHFAFVQRRIPSLFVHTGTHDDARTDRDTPAAVDAEHAARITRLVFYLAWDLANADMPPRWSAEGRRRWLLTRGSR